MSRAHIAELERTLQLLETAIAEARASVIEINDSGDESQYWLARMFERQIERSTRSVAETRQQIEHWKSNDKEATK